MDHRQWVAKILRQQRVVFELTWREQTQQKPNLQLLALCKEKPGFDAYFESMKLNFRMQKFAVMIRAGSLPLQACKDSARYARCGGFRASDSCPMCAGKEVEDVLHFLFHCPSYQPIKEKFYVRHPQLPATLAPCNLQSVARILRRLSQQESPEFRCFKMWHAMWSFRATKLKTMA
jgi:hypothetical protein